MKTFTCLLLSFVSFALFQTFSSVIILDSRQGFLQCLVEFSSNSTLMSENTYTPSNSSYNPILELTLNNLRFATPETPKPFVIVTPVEESQIQTVIYCSKKNGIQMRIRSGGHDFEGLSYVSQAPFVLLDMINLRVIDVDPVAATAWVESGATLGELYYAIAQKSNTLGFPGGVWSTVGVTGLIGGGGYGILRRKYGLAADNVIDARMIDANGRVLDRRSMGEDLFWAIRGGGTSSFGVILSWKLNLVPVPEIMTLFQVDKTLDQNATELVYRWQTVAPKLQNDVEIRIVVDTINKNSPNQASKTVLSESSTDVLDDKTIRVRFVGSFLGEVDNLLPLMQESFPELGLVTENCFQVSYFQAILVFSLFTPQTSPEVLLDRSSFRIPFKAKSDYVKQPISKEGLEGIWDMYLKNEPGKANMILTSYGGRMDEISESAIPFPHRAGTLYKMYMRVSTDGDSAAAFDWIRSLYSYLAPYTSPRTAYVNYNDLDLGVNNLQGPTSYTQASKWGKKYFKNNFDRLVQVKSIVDPTNFFRHEQSIPPL